MLLLVFSTRCFLQILIIARTNGDTSHFARVGIFNSGLRMTNFSLSRLTLIVKSNYKALSMSIPRDSISKFIQKSFKVDHFWQQGNNFTRKTHAGKQFAISLYGLSTKFLIKYTVNKCTSSCG